MKIFWPHRSDAKGFSIEDLARNYREKISSLSSDEISKALQNQFKAVSLGTSKLRTETAGIIATHTIHSK